MSVVWWELLHLHWRARSFTHGRPSQERARPSQPTLNVQHSCSALLFSTPRSKNRDSNCFIVGPVDDLHASCLLPTQQRTGSQLRCVMLAACFCSQPNNGQARLCYVFVWCVLKANRKKTCPSLLSSQVANQAPPQTAKPLTNQPRHIQVFVLFLATFYSCSLAL